jgi:hypothetical protein
MGALAGGAVGGLPGAAIGGLAGVAGGAALHQNMDDNNNDLQFRKQQLQQAQRDFDSARAGTNGGQMISTPYGPAPVAPQSVESAQAEFVKQIGFMNRALAAHNQITAKPPKSPVLPDLKTHQHRQPRDRTDEIAASFEKTLQSAQDGLYSLKERLTTDPQEKAMYEHFQNDDDDKSKTAAINDSYAAGKYGAVNSDIAKARRDQLLQIQADTKTEKDALINRQEDAAMSAQALALKTSDLQNQEDIVKGSLDLARTSDEKKALNDQLIDLQNQQVAAQLQAVLASKDSTDAEKKIAAARLALLPQLAAQAKAKNAQDNAGPIAAYLNAMPKTVDDIGESLQTAAVQGLGSLTDGIAAAINGTGTLKSAFSSLAMSIVTDLEKIVIEEEIVKPLANLLTGGSGGGGGLLGSIAKGIGGLFGGDFDPSTLASPALNIASAIPDQLPVSSIDLSGSLAGFRANGGATAPGNYMVGERGPEVVSIGAPANVTPTRALNALGGGGGNGTTINSTVNGVNDPALVRQLAAQTIFQALPATLRMSSDNTVKRLNRPTMR